MKKKVHKAAIIVLILLAAFLIYELSPIAVSIRPFVSYGCISVAFDKYEMKRADRLVLKQLHAGSVISTVECTDQKLIDDLVKETMVATTISGWSNDIIIEVYSDDTLIRTMSYGSHHDTIEVYQSDDKHLLWGGPVGYVTPSEELIIALKHALVTN